MPLIQLENLDDPRLDAYRDLPNRKIDSDPVYMVVEGKINVQRLFQTDWDIASVVVEQKKAQLIPEHVANSHDVYVIPTPLISQIIGYTFHNGLLACCKRPPNVDLDTLIKRDGDRATLVLCPNVNNTENMGSLIRIAAGLGATALIAGEKSCDPFCRRSLRVSMGTVFSMPIVRTNDMTTLMQQLTNQYGIQHIAAVLSDQAIPLSQIKRTGPVSIVLGSEGQGIDEQTLKHVQQHAIIPMSLGTDSLNVSVAGAICLYHLIQHP